MAETLEFFEENNRIMVEYNLKRMPLEMFLNEEKGKDIIKKIYFKIRTEHIEELKKDVKNIDNIGEVVGVFIRKHFLKKDKTFDVTILGQGNVVKFNLDKDTMNND